MPRGDKSKYTDKQKRQVKHIADGYGKPENHQPMKKGGRKGGSR